MSAFDIVERTTIPAILGSLPGIQFARTKNDSIERESVYIMGFIVQESKAFVP